jgi:glycosyltransferase 2 family protein
VLRRLSASPWTRAGLLAIALGFACYGLISQWPQVQAALGQLTASDVVGAVLAVIAALGCMMLAWRALLADLGSPLPAPAAIRVMFLGQLAKYVPGAVWAVAAQVSLAQDYRVPKRRSGTASLVSMAITLVVGLIMAGITLPLASAGALGHYWWVLACIPVILIGLYPPVTKFGLDLVLRIFRRPVLDKPLSLGGMARAVGWTTLGWIFYGVHAWLLVGDIAGKSLHILLLSAGGYALAWAVGFLLIPFPGGIGPREVALIAVLSPVMPKGPALVIALASRVVMTAGDLVWAGLAAVIGRRDRPIQDAAASGTVTAPGSHAAAETMPAQEDAAPGEVIPGAEGIPTAPSASARGVPAPAGRPGSAGPPDRRPSSRAGQLPGPPNAAGPPPPAR